MVERHLPWKLVVVFLCWKYLSFKKKKNKKEIQGRYQNRNQLASKEKETHRLSDREKDILARKMSGTGTECRGFNAISTVNHSLPSSSLSQSLSAFDRSEERIKAFHAFIQAPEYLKHEHAQRDVLRGNSFINKYRLSHTDSTVSMCGPVLRAPSG